MIHLSLTQKFARLYIIHFSEHLRSSSKVLNKAFVHVIIVRMFSANRPSSVGDFCRQDSFGETSCGVIYRRQNVPSATHPTFSSAKRPSAKRPSAKRPYPDQAGVLQTFAELKVISIPQKSQRKMQTTVLKTCFVT